MQFNVAQLMKAQVSTCLESDIHEVDVQLDSDIKVIGPIDGHVRMRRTNQGILADGWVDMIVELVCDRCLKEFQQPTHVAFEELFFPTLDMNTGLPIPAPIDEEDAFPIDDHHILDLTEAVRQGLLLQQPMIILCREDCPGLCPQCGHDLSLGPCDCQPEVVDNPFSILEKLLQNGSQPEQTR